MPAILAAALSRGLFTSRGSEAGGFGGSNVNEGEMSCNSLCSLRLLSGSGSEDMFGNAVLIAPVAACAVSLLLARWNRSICLNNSPDGLISASDAWLLSRIPRTMRSAVSWNESEAGGLSKLPDWIIANQ